MVRTHSVVRRLHSTPRRSFKPMLEVLEDRLTPSGYSLTDLGTPPNGFTTIYGASNINKTGQFVVEGSNSSNVTHVFLYNNGQWTDLGQPTNSGSPSGFPHINNSGQIVADYVVNGQEQAFLYSNGNWTQLADPSGAKSFEAYAMNDSGQIVGVANAHAFFYSNGQWTDLGVPSGFSSSTAYGINDSGQIIGVAYTNSTQAAFLYSQGQWTNLGAPIGYTNIEYDLINNSGQIVATDTNSNGARAFLYSSYSGWTDLGTVDGYPITVATADGNSGQIAGLAYNNNSQNPQYAQFLYSNGQITDLKSLLPSSNSTLLSGIFGINDSGEILADGVGVGQLQPHLDLLTPQQSTVIAISNGTVSPGTLTAGSSQQVTVSATITNNGAPVTGGNVVFSLVGPNGTIASDGSIGVAVGSNGQASDTLTVPAGVATGSYSLQVAYTNNNQTNTQAFAGALTINPNPGNVTPPSSPSPPPPPSLGEQIQQVFQDVATLEQDLMSGKLAAAEQDFVNLETLVVTVEQEIIQMLLNDLTKGFKA